MPGLGDAIAGRTIQTPVAFERLLPSCHRGTVTHGAMVPWQMGGQRPTPELGGYRTPVASVYKCGSGSQPGGGISMMPGRNAARVIRRDLWIGGATG